MNELIAAVIETLRSKTGLALSAAQCDEQPDGQPPPSAGQLYYAVHENSWTNNDTENIDEYFGVSVTITMRAGYVPKDRHAMALYREMRTKREELSRFMLEQRYVVMNLANTKIGENANGFVEPLRFVSGGIIEEKGPDWFSATSSTSTAAGVACTLVFNNARLVRPLIEYQEE